MAGSCNVGKSWIIPEGVDPETAFKIEVKIEGFLNKQDDGKKAYVKGRTITWVVDSDRSSLCEFNTDLAKELCWGKYQVPKIWILDKNEGTKAELVSESQIPEMFKMYEKERVIFLHVLVCDLEKSSDCSGTNDVDVYPCTPAQPTLGIEIGSQSQEGSNHGDAGLNDDLDHSLPAKTTLTQKISVDDQSDCVVHAEPIMTYDPENPKIEIGSSFPDVATFRKALRHFAIKNQFEVHGIKTDKKRFRGNCAHPSCPWRIHASINDNNKACVVKKLPHEHTCPSTTMVKGNMASKSWVSDRVVDWLKKNPAEGPKAVQKKLEDEFRVKVSYNKAWAGTNAARDQIQGSWEESFKKLFDLKCELEKVCSGSIVEVDVERIGNKERFNKAFVSLKPCIDGFLQGCRPYIAIDSTTLTGKYRGQLAAACGVDGNNSIYPIAYGVFDLEDKPNWTWFMTQLRKAIGSPFGLVISSDAGKGLVPAIKSTFPDCEHRECMRHLMENFQKKFHGEEIVKHMWSASRTYSTNAKELHLDKVKNLAPTAIPYLENHHKNIWCRSQFSEMSKCDYETNNLSESFNNWIKDYKSMHVVDLFDQIRQRILAKFDERRELGNKLQCRILPSVIKELNELSRNLASVKEVLRGGDDYAEVSGVDSEKNLWRYVVELDIQKCACREWQISGKPCMHAVAFICTLRGARLEDYVHEYYSVDRFRAAYAGRIPALNGKFEWEKANLDFKVWPPLGKRPAGRPRNQRIPGCLEANKRRQRCKKCKKLGHQQRTCKEDDPEAAAAKKRKRKRGARESVTDTEI